MLRPIDTRVPSQVQEQIQELYRRLFPQAQAGFVGRAFSWAQQCFEGRYGRYQPIDAKYHDFEHTLQGALCMARLLEGRQRAGATPALTQHFFELGLLAVLFHDSGYLKKQEDTSGTGAKYTLTHVHRSAEFAGTFLAQQGYIPEDIRAVQNMIRCTGVNTDPQTLPYGSDLERILGFALGTADLLGQMAAPDYIDKLPILYQEFDEANRFSSDSPSHLAGYRTAQDLMSKTPGFWEHCVLPRIKNHFQGLYTYLNDPYPNGPNSYLQRIEANLNELKKRLSRP